MNSEIPGQPTEPERDPLFDNKLLQSAANGDEQLLELFVAQEHLMDEGVAIRRGTGAVPGDDHIEKITAIKAQIKARRSELGLGPYE